MNISLAIIQPLCVTDSSCVSMARELVGKFIVPVERTSALVAIPISSIIRKCVFIQIDDFKYVSHLPNTYEKD